MRPAPDQLGSSAGRARLCASTVAPLAAPPMERHSADYDGLHADQRATNATAGHSVASTGAGALARRVRLRGVAAGAGALPLARATNAATMRVRSAAVYSCDCRAGCVALLYFGMFVRAHPRTCLSVTVDLLALLASRATAFGVNTCAAIWSLPCTSSALHVALAGLTYHAYSRAVIRLKRVLVLKKM